MHENDKGRQGTTMQESVDFNEIQTQIYDHFYEDGKNFFEKFS